MIMSIHYPRPPITVAYLFQSPPVEQAPLSPPWWPNDKQRVLILRPPAFDRTRIEEPR